MTKQIGIFFTALLFPVLVFAQSAGFPDKTLWLSDTSPVEGSAVQIYTILYNATDASQKGSLTFLVDDTSVGTLDIALPSGESRIYSVPWTAKSGSHNFSATFGASGSQSTQLSTAVSVSIAEPPSPVVEAISQSKNVAVDIASSSAPVIQNIAEKVYTATEAVRNAGVALLEKQIDPPAKKGTGTTNVEGFLAPEVASSSPSTLHNISQIAAVGMLYAFKTSWLFYFLALLLCYLLFRFVRRWVNRPRF